MSKSTDIRLREVTAETEEFAYRTPMKFGGRVVTDVVLLHVRAEVETADQWWYPSGRSQAAAGEPVATAAGQVVRQTLRCAQIAPPAHLHRAYPQLLSSPLQHITREVEGRDRLVQVVERLVHDEFPIRLHDQIFFKPDNNHNA